MYVNKLFNLIFGIWSLIIAGCVPTTNKGNADTPNLIFIFSDQHSFDMLGCYGNQDIITPNFDRFAKEGIKFNHCISNVPVCTPYRSVLLSGLHPLHNGALHNDIQMLPGDGNYFGEVLRDAGYHTGYFGKWHLYGGDRDRPIPAGSYRYGFDHEFLSNNCTMLYDKDRSYFWNDNSEKELYNDWEYNVQTRQSIDFIERNADKPIALFLSWHAPHDWMAGNYGEHKYSAATEFEGLYDLQSINLRPNCEDTELRRKYYQGHMAMITSLDNDFGDILKALDDKGIARNSIIIFTSDHGDMLESHGWPFNKGRPEIESIRVPLIIKWADKLKSRESDLLIGTLDLMPTILGLMNLSVPKTSQGQNHSEAIILGNDSIVSSVPLFYFAGDWRGVYTHDYTYAFSLKSGITESHALKAGFENYNVLYDHANDPYELNNLFGFKDFEQKQNELHLLSLNWMMKFGDKGVPFKELLPKVMVDEDYEIYQRDPRLRGSNYDGRVKNRPVLIQ